MPLVRQYPYGRIGKRALREYSGSRGVRFGIGRCVVYFAGVRCLTGESAMERDNRKTGGRGRRSDMDPAEGGVDPGSREMVERKGAKAASADAEARYRSIFEHAVNGIFQTTPEGRFLSVNPALAAMYGFSSPSEMLAAISNIEEQYVEPDERTRLKSILERDGTVSKFETELYRKDGGKVWVSMSARAVKDGNGNVAYYEGFVENVTDRKAAEEALRKEKETFFTILNNDPVGVILSGRTGSGCT